MAILSVKKLGRGLKKLRHRFSERTSQDYESLNSENEGFLGDHGSQNSNTAYGFNSGSVGQSGTTSPAHDSTISLHHDVFFTNANNITGGSTNETIAIKRSTTVAIHDLNVPIGNAKTPATESALPDPSITTEPNLTTAEVEALRTEPYASESEPDSKEYQPSQFEDMAAVEDMAAIVYARWKHMKKSDSEMEPTTPRRHTNAESHTTSPNTSHYVPRRNIPDISSRFNETNKLQNIRRKQFDIKIATLKMEFPEYAQMFTNPAFLEGSGLKTSPSASTLSLDRAFEDNAKRDVKTINVTAQAVNLTIKTDQFNSSVSEQSTPSPTNFSRSFSHRAYKQPPPPPPSSIVTTRSSPSDDYSPNMKLGRFPQSIGPDILASAKQSQENNGNGTSQAETPVSNISPEGRIIGVTEGDVTRAEEDAEAQARTSEPPNGARTRTGEI